MEVYKKSFLKSSHHQTSNVNILLLFSVTSINTHHSTTASPSVTGPPATMIPSSSNEPAVPPSAIIDPASRYKRFPLKGAPAPQGNLHKPPLLFYLRREEDFPPPPPCSDDNFPPPPPPYTLPTCPTASNPSASSTDKKEENSESSEFYFSEEHCTETEEKPR